LFIHKAQDESRVPKLVDFRLIDQSRYNNNKHTKTQKNPDLDKTNSFSRFIRGIRRVETP